MGFLETDVVTVGHVVVVFLNGLLEELVKMSNKVTFTGE